MAKTNDKRICGYCYTNSHDKCKPEIRWYENVWYCYCETCGTNKEKLDEEKDPEETSNEE